MNNSLQEAGQPSEDAVLGTVSDRFLDQVLTRTLESRTEPTIPANFAARVRAALPQHVPQRSASHIGRNVAIAAAILIAIALFVVAPHAAPSVTNFAFALELLLVAQLTAIAYVLATRKV